MYVVADERYEKKDERNRVGKMHDPVTDNGLFTVIGVWSRTIPTQDDDPIVAVMRKQQELVKRYRDKKLGAFIAFLGLKLDFPEDSTRDQRIAEVANIARGAKVPLVSVGLAEATVAADGDAGKDGATKIAPQVAAWGIAPDDALTIVVYHRFKIVKRWKFAADKPPTDKDLDELTAVIESIEGKRAPVQKE